MLPGAFDSPESRSAFAAFLLELQAAPHQPQPPAALGGITVAELLVAYLDYAEGHYRTPDGQPTSEIYEVKVVIRALRELYADTPVSSFGPLCVKAARQKWVNDGRSRSECNRRVALIKRIFKWAVSEELAPPLVYQGVASVAGLQKGRTVAWENEPVGPVDDEVVEATLPYLDRHVRGLVEFQRLTGCRPGEACVVRRCELDMTGRLWLYKPPHHKTAHRGKDRTIILGPKAQALVRDFFTPVRDDFLFSPLRAAEERRVERAAKRRSKRPPSQVNRDARRRSAPKRHYRSKYDRGSYGLAIDRACEQAFPLPPVLARGTGESRAAWWARLSEMDRAAVQVWRKAHRWHPNQLRHSFATQVRKQHGLEAAQVLLGHSRADVTQVYAERNRELAAKVAAKIG
jgi:integrase